MAELQDASFPTIVAAIEKNFEDWWAYYQHAPQAVVHDEPELLLVASGIPIAEYNGVARTHVPSVSGPHALDAKIASAVEFFARRGVRLHWYVTPSSQPPDLARHLLAHGFVQDGQGIGMAMDLSALPERRDPPAGLTVERVASPEALRRWTDIAGAGYGEPESVLQARFDVHLNLGLDENAPLQRYIALIDGEPVGMSALFLSAGGVAGVYDVATAQWARRRGAGRAVTLAALDAARALGYHLGVLQASPMGLPLYRAIGFKEYCQFDRYELAG